MFRILMLSLGFVALAAASELWATLSPTLPGLAPLGAAQAQETDAATVPKVEPFSIGNPDAPVKSRFQMSWPGAPGRPGCSTSDTSGRPRSHSAMARPDFICRSSRTSSVRMPRSVRYMSSGPANRPISS